MGLSSQSRALNTDKQIKHKMHKKLSSVPIYN